MKEQECGFLEDADFCEATRKAIARYPDILRICSTDNDVIRMVKLYDLVSNRRRLNRTTAHDYDDAVDVIYNTLPTLSQEQLICVIRMILSWGIGNVRLSKHLAAEIAEAMPLFPTILTGNEATDLVVMGLLRKLISRSDMNDDDRSVAIAEMYRTYMDIINTNDTVARAMGRLVRRFANVQAFAEYVKVYDIHRWHVEILRIIPVDTLRQMRQKSVSKILELLRQRKSKRRTAELMEQRDKLEWIISILSRTSSEGRVRDQEAQLDILANQHIQETIMARLRELEENIYHGSLRPVYQFEQLRAMSRKIRGDRRMSTQINRQIDNLQRRSRVG